jgi:hypothetical protein
MEVETALWQGSFQTLECPRYYDFEVLINPITEHRTIEGQ